jgi:hypothetical protein
VAPAGDDRSAALVAVGALHSDQRSAWRDAQVQGLATTSLADISLLGGLLRVDHIRARAEGTSGVARSGEGDAAGDVGAATLAGIPVTLSSDGLHVPNGAIGADQAQALERAFNEVLAAHGAKLFLAEPRRSAGRGELSARWDGLSLQVNLADVPSGSATLLSLSLGKVGVDLQNRSITGPAGAAGDLPNPLEPPATANATATGAPDADVGAVPPLSESAALASSPFDAGFASAPASAVSQGSAGDAGGLAATAPERAAAAPALTAASGPPRLVRLASRDLSGSRWLVLTLVSLVAGGLAGAGAVTNRRLRQGLC